MECREWYALRAAGRNGRVGIPVKICKLIYIIPYDRITCMKNMGPIAVHLYPFYLFRINISSDLISFLQNEALFPTFLHLMYKNRTIQPRSNDQIIKLSHSASPFPALYSHGIHFYSRHPSPAN